MKEDESRDSFYREVDGIITKAATCGLMFDEQTKVRKVLNAVPDKFLPIVANIEMIVDFKTVKLEEIVGKLRPMKKELNLDKGAKKIYVGPLQFDGPRADTQVMSLCVEDIDYMGRIKKLNEYLEKVQAMVKPGCSQDLVKAALSAMSSVTDIHVLTF
ncbi:hypothetical protein Tco_0415252 [Tanacetum coccineum]